MSFFALFALALACTLFDHIGLAFFPHQELFRAAGCFAFPLFCFLFSEYFKHNKNWPRYGLYLILLALVSEIPFNLLVFGHTFDPTEQNAIFSLFISLCALSVNDILSNNKVLRVLSGFTFCLLAMLLRVSYGFLGPLLCLCFYCADTKMQCVLFDFMVSFLYAIILIAGGTKLGWLRPILAAPLSCLPIYLYKGKQGIQERQLFFFCCVFWPSHMFLFYFLRWARVIPPWFPS